MRSRLAAPLLFASLLAPATAAARVRCRTQDVRLERAAYLAYAGESDRPASVGFVDSDVYPIRVHYRSDADADRAADVVVPSAELAWEAQVDGMGWPTPPADGGLGGDDRFDLYLTNEDTEGGAWTWGPLRDVTPSDDWYSVASFVALDDRWITDADMSEFVVHEFNHALQFTLDGQEQTLFVWESIAEAMEELVLPDSDLYFLDIPDFQALPFASLLFDGYSQEVEAYNSYSYYEYGGSIVGLYLEHAYGQSDGTTLLQLWLDLAQGSASAEPDYVDALGGIGGATDPTYEDVYLGLAEWRMFVADDDDGAHFAEGARWGRGSKVATEGTLTLSMVDGTTVSPTDPPYDLGTSYWEIEVDDAVGGLLHLELDGEDTVEWGIVAAAWLDGAPARVVRARGDAGETASLDLDLTGATQVMVAVANFGGPDLDAEARHPREDFTLGFARDEAADTDSGDTDSVDSDDRNPFFEKLLSDTQRPISSHTNEGS